MRFAKILVVMLLFVGGASAFADNATIVGGSALLTQNQADQLATWLGQGPIQLTNVFSHTGADAKTATDFYAATAGIGPTFLVLQANYTNNQNQSATALVGGYNPVSWVSSSDFTMAWPDALRTAFIFNLTTGVKQAEKVSSNPVCPNCGAYQTYHPAYYGPTFGYGYDLAVDSSLNYGFAVNYSYGASVNGQPDASAIISDSNYGPGRTYAYSYSGLEVYTIQQAPTPEPGTLLLLGTGLAALVGAARKRLRK